MRVIIIFVLGLVWSQTILASEKKSFILKVMNYNVKGVPAPWYRHFRHKYIGSFLNEMWESGEGAHVVAIQEAMHRKARKNIPRYAQYPYVASGPGRKGFKISSGLKVLSQYPMSGFENILYRACKGIDCMSRKGIQKVLINIPEVPFPIAIYNTHMQAKGIKAVEARLGQLNQLLEFIQGPESGKDPYILLGDFNMKHWSVEYANMTNMLDAQSAIDYCASENCPNRHAEPRNFFKRKLVDYQLYSSNNYKNISIRPIYYDHFFENTRVRNRFGRSVKLSDHDAVMVHYLIEWEE